MTSTPVPLTRFRDRILARESFQKAVLSGPPEGLAWKRIQIRPVQLKQGFRWQVSRFDEKKDVTKNYDEVDFPPVLNELLGLEFRHLLVEDAAGTLNLTLKSPGKVLAKETRRTEPAGPAAVPGHDRKKPTLLDPDGPPPFLGALEFLTEKGTIKADMRDKFKQINEFLRILDETGAFRGQHGGFSVVDFGCGNAYLTFALYHHLFQTLKLDTRITGVDLKAELMDRHRRRAAGLGWTGLDFAPGTIQDYRREEAPDAVVALHACDTATDDAIARGISWGCSLIVVAPCCQHHLQVQLAAADHPEAQNPLFRYGLMSERLGDLLTDTFRALLLRKAGYTVDILQFVDASHTPKNLMIRAVKTGAPAPQAVSDEYDAMKAYWGVAPYLEGRLLDLEPGKEGLAGPAQQ